jgi:hypothetical protein
MFRTGDYDGPGMLTVRGGWLLDRDPRQNSENNTDVCKRSRLYNLLQTSTFLQATEETYVL